MHIEYDPSIDYTQSTEVEDEDILACASAEAVESLIYSCVDGTDTVFPVPTSESIEEAVALWQADIDERAELERLKEKYEG